MWFGAFGDSNAGADVVPGVRGSHLTLRLPG